MGLNPLSCTVFLVLNAVTLRLELVNHSLDFVTFALLFKSLFVFFLESAQLTGELIALFALLGNLFVLVSHFLIVLF